MMAQSMAPSGEATHSSIAKSCHTRPVWSFMANPPVCKAGAQVSGQLRQTQPDAAILDWRMQGRHGMAMTATWSTRSKAHQPRGQAFYQGQFESVVLGGRCYRRVGRPCLANALSSGLADARVAAMRATSQPTANQALGSDDTSDWNLALATNKSFSSPIRS